MSSKSTAPAARWQRCTPSYVKTLPVLDFPFDTSPDIFAPASTVLRLGDGSQIYAFQWCHLRREGEGRGVIKSFDIDSLSEARAKVMPLALERLSKWFLFNNTRPRSVERSLHKLGFLLSWADQPQHAGRYEALLSDPVIALEALKGYHSYLRNRLQNHQLTPATASDRDQGAIACLSEIHGRVYKDRIEPLQRITGEGTQAPDAQAVGVFSSTLQAIFDSAAEMALGERHVGHVRVLRVSASDDSKVVELRASYGPLRLMELACVTFAGLAFVDFRAERLAAVVERMKGLGFDPARGARLDRFIAGRLTEHQTALKSVVAAYTGMRVGEVSVLPLEDVLDEFEHLGSMHYELRGSTYKLHRGIKRPTTWITSHQGARAVRLAQRIAHAIHQEHPKTPKAGQRALLFPSTQNPYRAMGNWAFQRGVASLRANLCPVIEQADIDELDRLELARGWARDDIVVGKRWPLAFHQLRRSLAVYAHRSGMVSLPALKAQLQHIIQEMSAYYADGFSRAVNLVFDKEHFSHEWKAARAESSYFAYAFGLLFSDDDLLGQGAKRMANTVESRSRQDTLRLFEENKLAYCETPLGGCVSTEPCKTDPLEPIPYDCLETNCVNLVVFRKRLDHVIKFQEVAVATLERDEEGSVEHRLEARHLEVLLKASNRLPGAQ